MRMRENRVGLRWEKGKKEQMKTNTNHWKKQKHILAELEEEEKVKRKQEGLNLDDVMSSLLVNGCGNSLT